MITNNEYSQNNQDDIHQRKIENEKKYEQIKEIYNLYCVQLPQIQKITEKRKVAINKFLKEIDLEQFEQVCIKANQSDFLTGDNDRGWKADFDFLIRTDKAISILEGKYDNKKRNKGNFDDFKNLWEEARIEDEQTGNNSSNNTFSW